MRIILYGAGRNGRGIYSFLKTYGLSEYVYGFCDKRANEIGIIEDKRVWFPEELKGEDIIYCITVSDVKAKEEIKANMKANQWIEFSDLADMFNLDKVKFNRDFCAFYHLENMGYYYQQAEADDNIEVFWNQDSIFYELFQKLDLTNVIEIGCGHGRHVPQIINLVNSITLVDILQKILISVKRDLGKMKK